MEETIIKHTLYVQNKNDDKQMDDNMEQHHDSEGECAESPEDDRTDETYQSFFFYFFACVVIKILWTFLKNLIFLHHHTTYIH